jgi:hypothetical protein
MFDKNKIFEPKFEDVDIAKLWLFQNSQFLIFFSILRKQHIAIKIF